MKFILKNAKLSFLALIICFSFSACDENDDFMFEDDVIATPNPDPDPDPDPTDDGSSETNTIIDYINADENYSSLAAAIEAAGLTATLEGDTNYTVFAPDNDAFEAFLSDNGFATLDDVPVELLTLFLMNHVQSGIVMAADLSTGYIESMAEAGPEGENVSLYINTEGGVTLNGVSTVTTADIEVDNGVIHAVDTVIPLPDITTFALADPDFATLVAALTREEAYEFVMTLQLTDDSSPFTVFAPNNEAFTALLAELELASLDDVDSETLSSILSYHVVTGDNLTSDEITDGLSVATLVGESFTLNLGDDVTITDVNERTSTIIEADIQTVNGVLHVIDTVLIPTLD